MDGLAYGRTDGQADRQLSEQGDRWTDERVDGWTERRTDGRSDIKIKRHCMNLPDSLKENEWNENSDEAPMSDLP
jgi:hypothetical protein